MESDESLWIVLQIGFVLLLVALNGFFVAAEFALVKIRDSQIKPLIRKGNRKAIMTQKVLDHLDASLSACQLGITLARQGYAKLAGTQGSIQMIQYLLGHDCLAVSLANQGFDL